MHVPVTSNSMSKDEPEDLQASYLRLLTMIERLHRQLLDVIKDELERINQTDINAVQALLLFNIGDSELTAGELRSRGHYLGSNVSYNLKKLVDGGYIDHKRSKTDRRSVRISLTEKGQDACEVVENLYQRQLGSIEAVGELNEEQFVELNRSLGRLERFWSDMIRFQL